VAIQEPCPHSPVVSLSALLPVGLTVLPTLSSNAAAKGEPRWPTCGTTPPYRLYGANEWPTTQLLLKKTPGSERVVPHLTPPIRSLPSHVRSPISISHIPNRPTAPRNQSTGNLHRLVGGRDGGQKDEGLPMISSAHANTMIRWVGVPSPRHHLASL
jgi:hypothetical protein